jgi:hypothetical protein
MARGHSGTRAVAEAIQLLGIRMGGIPEKPSRDLPFDPFKWPIHDLARATLHRPVDAPPRPAELRRFVRGARRYMRWLGDRPMGWGWKFPETYLVGNYVAAAFPEARYVHVVRDGRDVAFKWHRSDRPDQRLGYRLLRHLGALDQPHPMQAALSWDFQVRRFERFARMRAEQVHTISFESLCTEPVATMEGVSRFLGVPMTDECREYLAAQIRPEKVAQHRHEDPAEVARVEAAIEPTLRRYGYVKARERTARASESTAVVQGRA